MLINLHKQSVLTVTLLKQLFFYDPRTGIFTRRSNGLPAGTITPRGYRSISINKRNYFAHRLAWFYVHGQWPVYGIDHANCVRDDNRLDNLREATDGQNNANRGPKQGRRLKGITRHRDKWQAQLTSNGRNLYLGRFDTAEQAAAAYAAKACEVHGKFGRSQ